MSNHDPFDLRSQERTKAQLDEKTKLAVHTEQDDFKWLMGSKRGRRILWRLLEQCGVYRSSFHNSGSVTAFNEGQRNIGLRLLAQIHSLCPDQFSAMLKEQQNDRDSDDGSGHN